MLLFNFPHDGNNPFIRKVRIFAALQNNGPKSQLISLVAAGEDLLLAQAVSLRVFIPASDTAIIAVVLTVVRKLDQAAQIYLFPVNFFPNCSGFC